ncbi:hypothetical protein [Xenorhabdus sp. BG5]|uniref:hypothetical protein n=1 Tax=Xenorhabdus sp. BG5 TaxID=2782014 RepID=UPI00187E005C|nr:hypothetical protein [Xenorhabdus sp. BG5]MBE8598147.1 hypothetical protein [Xenorhabdus sp. BG5]
MTENELRENLKYLIDKYVLDINKRIEIYAYIEREDVPVKGILADLNEFGVKTVTNDDGKLISDIYFHYC